MSKGEQTQERIVERALKLASRDGLEGLTIGSLAADLHLSKSGLFAHFQSKEGLQVAVMEAAARRFAERVVRPALVARRGTARMRALFENWLGWMTDPEMPGGCIFMAAATELDDRPGHPREVLVRAQKELLDFLAGAARLGVEAGELRPDLETGQLAFEWYGIMASFHHARRLMGDPEAEARARQAFDRLLADAAKGADRG